MSEIPAHFGMASSGTDARWPKHEWANVSGALMDTGDLPGDMPPSVAIRRLDEERKCWRAVFERAMAALDYIADYRGKEAGPLRRHARRVHDQIMEDGWDA